MLIFVNEVPVHLRTPDDLPTLQGTYHQSIYAHAPLPTQLTGHALVQVANAAALVQTMQLVQQQAPAVGLQSLTIMLPYGLNALKVLSTYYTHMDAAGGVVQHQNQLLLIERLGKWDLPKGKLEGQETPEVGGQREVEEECGITAQVQYLICCTWHTYVQRGQAVLKRTYWYAMQAQSAAGLTPQTEEDITQALFMGPEQVQQAMQNTYASIRYVLRCFNERG